MKITLAKPISFSPQTQGRDGKRKKLDLREVFNPDEDDSNTQVKKRKLVPLDYSEDKKAKKDAEKKTEESIKSQEEKKKHIKSLIEKIPTEKDALFAYDLDWSAIDGSLMDRKIRPWINKKIIEYIGEPEPTLVDFICSKVLAGSQPQIILQDVQMVSTNTTCYFIKVHCHTGLVVRVTILICHFEISYFQVTPLDNSYFDRPCRPLKARTGSIM